jgi:hypothetical protein
MAGHVLPLTLQSADAKPPPPCVLDKGVQVGCCSDIGAATGRNSGAIGWLRKCLLAEISPTISRLMSHRLFSFAGALCTALWLLAVAEAPCPALAQGNDAKPAEKAAAPGQEGGKEPHKVDEFAEAQHSLNGPAGNPECVWLGRRVVNLLWRDDLDTAFRHLDLYDRFGCPGGHIQATFRCLILHGNNIDPKAADSLNARIQACWINPSEPSIPTPAPAPATAAVSSGSSH